MLDPSHSKRNDAAAALRSDGRVAYHSPALRVYMYTLSRRSRHLPAPLRIASRYRFTAIVPLLPCAQHNTGAVVIIVITTACEDDGEQMRPSSTVYPPPPPHHLPANAGRAGLSPPDRNLSKPILDNVWRHICLSPARIPLRIIIGPVVGAHVRRARAEPEGRGGEGRMTVGVET